MKPILFVILFYLTGFQIISAQSYSEILGRPTDTSVTMNIMFDQSMEVYWEIGSTSGTYSTTTATYTTVDSLPIEVDFNNLLPNNRYYYRSRYRPSGSSSSFAIGNQHSFHTQRPRGSTFSFAVEADPHLDTNTIPASYTLTLQNMLSANPDFLIDLGDNFMSEKEPVINQTTITGRTKLFRPYFNEVCHSAPLFLTIGNHEGELGWKIDGTATSMPVLTANTRKLYYPNPLPNGFYSGNTVTENYVGLRENYYAWEWGNALFVVIDPYWYTTMSQRAGWGWTLGSAQYNWFKNTIINSTAKFKFVFCHQLVGGNGNDARGGTEYVDYFEMGGKNADNTPGFATNRPGWSDPIHQLLVNNNGSIYFHGHDHFYGMQKKDCIIYQEVPQPSAKNIKNNLAAGYGYINGVFLPSRGYLYVTVGTDSVKVDYIKTYLPNEENATQHNKDVAHSYTIGSCNSGLPINLLSFTGKKEGKSNMLLWTTASEFNNDHFEIERSKDGIEFEQIGTVKGIGNSNTITNYTFRDILPVKGINFYRLKQYDHDGKYQYSRIITLTEKNNSDIKMYPNPAKNKVFIQIGSAANYIRKFDIIDPVGRVVYSTSLPKNSLNITMDISTLKPGVYSVRMPDQTNIYSYKLIIVK